MVALKNVLSVSVKILWWFLGRKQQQQATQTNGIQEVLITVDGGYRPDRIVVVVGELVRLSFDRLDNNSCLKAGILHLISPIYLFLFKNSSN